MKKTIIILILLILFVSCNTKLKYAAYNPAQNRFVKFVNKESVFGDYDYQTGDTVLLNNEKVVIIAPF